jgi:D-glycero-alpha-D-manno-heptose 1-phosphate guanylyltransferase
MNRLMPDTIILAGGLGTRLKEAVPDVPKCMAPVADRPFLDYLIQYLEREGISTMIFSLGYRHEIITNHLQSHFPAVNKLYSIEDIPLGTGGGILHALPGADTEAVIIMNGDTFFNIDLRALVAFHTEKNADITIALKPMTSFSRYGSVEVGKDMRINAFLEKKHMEEGLINGGIYAVKKEWLLGLALPHKCSFEKDVLEVQVQQGKIFGFISDAYFIDIGIPEDYKKAQTEVPEFV